MSRRANRNKRTDHTGRVNQPHAGHPSAAPRALGTAAAAAGAYARGRDTPLLQGDKGGGGRSVCWVMGVGWQGAVTLLPVCSWLASQPQLERQARGLPYRRRQAATSGRTTQACRAQGAGGAGEQGPPAARLTWRSSRPWGWPGGRPGPPGGTGRWRRAGQQSPGRPTWPGGRS